MFNGGNDQECRTTSLCQILLKPRSRYRNFWIFQMAAAVILDFKIVKFLTFGHAKKVEPLHCAKFGLNRSNPGRHMVIFYYSRWRPPPFLKFHIFKDWNGQERRTVSSGQITSKLHQLQPRYGDFSIFQDGGRRHLGFSKFHIFNSGTVKRVELRHRAKFR